MGNMGLILNEMSRLREKEVVWGSPREGQALRDKGLVTSHKSRWRRDMSLEFQREQQGSLNWPPVTGIQMVAMKKIGTRLFSPQRFLLREQILSC